MGVDANARGWKTNRRKLVRKVTEIKEKMTFLSSGLLQIETENCKLTG